MTKLRKCFGGIDMTWPKVLIFAVISAVYTAAVNLIPALSDTSLQDIAINPECWLLFAVFIIMNCGTWKEASLKCFVFFLVSQPLIYLIEVPFNSMGWGVFRNYGYWFMIFIRPSSKDKSFFYWFIQCYFFIFVETFTVLRIIDSTIKIKMDTI